MNLDRIYGLARCVVRSLAALLTAPALVWAAAGAHGPDGEHLDAPGDHAHAHAPASDAPRMQAASELFELVATLAGGELSILIDRYATNAPVLGAKVEVAAGNARASAQFHADNGDYAVADEAFLTAISRPGEHALVFTIVAGNESDLLDGVLRVAPAAVPDAHGAAHRPHWPWAVPAAAIAAALAVAGWRLRRRAPARSAP